MRVVGYSAKGKRIESDKKFIEEDDWLDSLTIKLKNTSDKPLVFIEVSLNFPAMEETPEGPGPGYVRDIKYGREPLPGEQASSQTKLIMPNEDVDIVLSDRDRKAIKNALNRLNFPKNTYVKVLLRTVIFNDETMWRAGEILNRDENEPGTWRVIRRVQGSFLREESIPKFTSLYRLNPARLISVL